MNESIEGTLREVLDLTKKNKARTEDAEQNVLKLRKELSDAKRTFLSGSAHQTRRGPTMPVSEGCARHLGAILVMSGFRQGKLQGNRDSEKLLQDAQAELQLDIRATLTTTDIPLPTQWSGEVVELVYEFGDARKYATVFPIGTATTKLPRLKTSPAFNFIDMAASVNEKSPQIEYVDFTALKAGGLIRVPSEISADSIVGVGQFLARYAAREFASWEDTCLFLADGTATYKTRSGVAKTADTATKRLVLGAGNTHPSDITLANLRTLRAVVDGAALSRSAYYCHPTMESLFAGFNISGNTPWQPNGPNGPTLDGYPVRWVGVMPTYGTAAAVNQYQVLFGDLSYWYFGERGLPEVRESWEAYFSTDEIAIRALERFDIGCMALGSMAVLKLAAS